MSEQVETPEQVLQRVIANQPDELKLALAFHQTYERLAPNYGYETRKDTRAFDTSTANGKLMIAVCRELLQTGVIHMRPSADATQPDS